MALLPTVTEILARARADLRMGLPVVIAGETSVLAGSPETLNRDRLEAILAEGGGVLAITSRRAATLRARPYDGDLARVTLPADVDTRWLQAVSDPSRDLDHPMKGPLQTLRDGDASLHRLALRLVKSARLLPAAVVAPAYGPLSALTLVPAALAARALDDMPSVDHVVSARLPISVSEAGRLHVFRPGDGSEEHYAVEIGQPDRASPVLARIHSACFTGDVLGSLKCDCGPQLQTALGQMGREGAGVLLYLNQEGRGIGLANKMRAYSLQDQGFDTVEANHRLGFEDDERDFRLGSEILHSMGFSQVRLMTNNPAKIDMLERCGLKVVERVPLKTPENRFNHHYLATKASKSGHLL